MSIEAMKQALEALKNASPHLNEALQNVGGMAEYEVELECDRAITALRTSIEAAEKQEPVLWLVNGVVQVSDIPADYTGCLYTTPPAAQEEIQRLTALVRAQQITIDKLEAAPVQEPVVTTFPMKLTCGKCGAVDEGTLTVEQSPAAPVQEPMTDQQIKWAKPFCADFVSFRAGVRYAEAKLRSKNGGQA
jgi:hypothetical protein